MIKNTVLTTDEFHVVTSSDFFLNKQSATSKIQKIFDECSSCFQFDANKILCPAGTEFHIPRITKGENYYAYPYIVMDIPYFYTMNEIFVCRILCWFSEGLFFSLMISSQNLPHYLHHLFSYHKEIERMEVVIGIDDIWDFRKTMNVHSQNIDEVITRCTDQKFIRLQIRHDLQILNDTTAFKIAACSFVEIMKKITHK